MRTSERDPVGWRASDSWGGLALWPESATCTGYFALRTLHKVAIVHSSGRRFGGSLGSPLSREKNSPRVWMTSRVSAGTRRCTSKRRRRDAGSSRCPRGVGGREDARYQTSSVVQYHACLLGARGKGGFLVRRRYRWDVALQCRGAGFRKGSAWRRSCSSGRLRERLVRCLSPM